ncbi:hypothetical protein Efla_007145 [Eimeria flavescens]
MRSSGNSICSSVLITFPCLLYKKLSVEYCASAVIKFAPSKADSYRFSGPQRSKMKLFVSLATTLVALLTFSHAEEADDEPVAPVADTQANASDAEESDEISSRIFFSELFTRFLMSKFTRTTTCTPPVHYPPPPPPNFHKPSPPHYPPPPPHHHHHSHHHHYTTTTTCPPITTCTTTCQPRKPHHHQFPQYPRYPD